VINPSHLIRRGIGAGRQFFGMASKPKPGLDDQTVKSKVESTIFRDADAPKGSVDVNVVDGVVELRGEVERPEIKEELEEEALAVPEVWDVRNHLHLPNTPAPTRPEEGVRTQRKIPKTDSQRVS